jgi:ATP-dependent RNA helicase RhlE
MKPITFDDLNLSNALKNALADLGLQHPTAIQHKSYNTIMSGRDVVCIAQTGTGKTFAYLLPCLRQLVYSKERKPQVLIVVPTRELVAQVVGEVELLTKYMEVTALGVFGGTSMNTQKEQVLKGMDVLVATPGRLIDLVLCGVLKLKSIKKMVIDEMDEMLNLGFRPQLSQVLEFVPERRQNLLFSATITPNVEAFIEDNFNGPIKIEAAPSGTPLDTITQVVYKLPNFNTKVNMLKLLLAKQAAMSKVLVFVANKKIADQLHVLLSEAWPERIGLIHSNKDQNYRFKSVNFFENGLYRVLIATDVIARGIDVTEVTDVINFDAPEPPENYIHRIGRTGRAESKGNAISFLVPDDKLAWGAIETMMNKKIRATKLPVDLELSTELTDDEIPKIKMKNIVVKAPKDVSAGEAFHDKIDKNKKVNNKIRRADELRMKYKKPITKSGLKRR